MTLRPMARRRAAAAGALPSAECALEATRDELEQLVRRLHPTRARAARTLAANPRRALHAPAAGRAGDGRWLHTAPTSSALVD
jgi:hypothetical protein